MVALGQLNQLRKLDLFDTAVTSEGVDQLRDLTELQRLGLEGSQVDDGALRTIAKFTRLKSLWLSRTRVTAEGAAAFRKALPGAKVDWR